MRSSRELTVQAREMTRGHKKVPRRGGGRELGVTSLLRRCRHAGMLL
jgi:hypothetical protein